MIGVMLAIEGLERLAIAVGSDELVASCVVDQPYAQIQHEELTWHHPQGGRAKYLEGPLFENSAEIVQIMSDTLVTIDGSDIVNGMVKIAEKMSDWVEENAPTEDNELRQSGHPSVISGNTIVYDRPPKMARVNN